MLDLNDFPEFKPLQENHQAIIAELQRVQLWLDYRSDVYNADGDCIFMHGEGWQIWPVYFGMTEPADIFKVDGMTEHEVSTFCGMLPADFPVTTELLSVIPSVNYAAFSKLSASTSLTPHSHENPDSLILHMALEIPPRCGLRIDGEMHRWGRPGEQVIFDDNKLHSAWNLSQQDRIVLYVDFER